jgi:phosphatidylglycerol:prolipoprotein diacylglycerol transferase
MPALGCAIFFFRLGCFLNGCCFSWDTHCPIAISFPPGSRVFEWQSMNGLIPRSAVSSLPVHPLQLYYASLGLLLAVMAMRWRRARRFDGEVWLRFYALYCSGTFALELMQTPGLHLNLMLSGLGMLVLVPAAFLARMVRTSGSAEHTQPDFALPRVSEARGARRVSP